jgi:hypothetical protein
MQSRIIINFKAAPNQKSGANSEPSRAKSSYRGASETAWNQNHGSKSDLMRFLEVILGALMAAPMRLLPVMKIPLHAPTRDEPSP